MRDPFRSFEGWGHLAPRPRPAACLNVISVGTSSAPSDPFADMAVSHMIHDGAESASLYGGWHHDADYFGLLGRQFPVTTRAGGNIPAAVGNGTCWGASFTVVGRGFAIRIDGGDSLLGRYRVTINGVRHYPVNSAGVGPGRRWWSFELPPGKNRVVVEGYGDARWFGFKVSPGSVVAPGLVLRRTVVFGDSFTAGSGAAASWDGWAGNLRSDPAFVVAASGSGGTGYVNDLGGAQAALPARIATDFSRIRDDTGGADEVVIAMGLNDVGLSGIQAAATASFDALRAVYSGPVWVLGPWDTAAPAAPSSDWISARDEIRAAVADHPGFAFVDMQGVAFSKSDGTHPDSSGHLAIAATLGSRLAAG